jgi:hypothetical protein
MSLFVLRCITLYLRALHVFWVPGIRYLTVKCHHLCERDLEEVPCRCMQLAAQALHDSPVVPALLRLLRRRGTWHVSEADEPVVTGPAQLLGPDFVKLSVPAAPYLPERFHHHCPHPTRLREVESSHLGLHLLPTGVCDAENVAVGEAPCNVRPAASDGYGRELAVEARHDAFAMVCAAEPWHDLYAKVLQCNELYAVKYELNASASLLLLAKHVHYGAVTVHNAVRDTSRLLSVVVHSVRPDGDEKPPTMVQLVLPIYVEHKQARHFGELSYPLHLVERREDQGFDVLEVVIVKWDRVGGERLELIQVIREIMVLSPVTKVPNVLYDDTSGLSQLGSPLLVLVDLQGLDTCDMYIYVF